MNLQQFNPDPTDWTPQSAYAWCTRLARDHYENFPVASLLLPPDLRPDVAAVYAFARIADDLADEPGLATEERLHHLATWGRMLEACVRERPSHPAFLALGTTVRTRRLPLQLFRDLLSAFRQDVTTNRYETFAALRDYCHRSADPVGRIILRLFGYDDETMDRESDAICTALQLTNFWQDLSQDLSRDRLYLPAEDAVRFGLSPEPGPDMFREGPFRKLIAFQVERTRDLFHQGKPLLFRPNGRLSVQLRLTWHGGMRVLDKIERSGYNVLHTRPRLVGIDAAILLARALSRS